MPQTDDNSTRAITVYSPKSDKTLQVKGSKAYKAAISAGWLSKKPAVAQALTPQPGADKPPAQAQSNDPAGMAKGMAGAATQSPVGRFLQGFGAGFNPFHTAPEGMPAPYGKAEAFGEDMLNLREIGQKGQTGDKAGGAGLMAGTVASLAGPELLKGLGTAAKGGAMEAKALTAASKAAAGKEAASLITTIKGSIKDARLGAQLVQPHREMLDKMYEPLHKLLDQEVIPHMPQVEQMAKRMSAATEPAIRKLGEDILQKVRATPGGKTLMTFADGHALHKQIQEMAGHLHAYRIGQWSNTIDALDKAIQSSKESVATSKGVAKEMAQINTWYKRMHQIEASAAQSVTKSLVRQLAQKVYKVGKFVPSADGVVGKTEMAEAQQLMNEMRGTAKSKAMQQIGNITTKAAKAYKYTNIGYKAILNAFKENAPDGPGV